MGIELRSVFEIISLLIIDMRIPHRILELPIRVAVSTGFYFLNELLREEKED